MITRRLFAAAMVSLPWAALSQPLEPFPGITVDREANRIELTGRIAVEANSPETPEVVIEVIAEAGGVRDHEAIVTLDAGARQVHAALLLLGLEPGAPGRFSLDGERIDPTGPPLTVELRYTADDEEHTIDPAAWIVDRETGESLADRSPRFVFGGSAERVFGAETVYMAEAEGAVVGLSTFGVGEPGSGIETVGMAPVMSPDSGSGDPIWIARPGALPPADTPVTVVLTATDGDAASPDRRSDRP
ncbi:MAG: YdjY domain-containing protein [Planctomycetota bacterium]